jgi:Holliday junction resolvase-like predicted endonuclease
METIPSESVCYPAKLAHGHIENLISRGIKDIFYPDIPYEALENKDSGNHYNCPIVCSYPEVIRNNVENIKEKDINFGSVYENVAAQELKAHGFDLYYFNSKKQGELDFVVEQNGNVLPIEIKSGKDYTKHAALSNVMANNDYDIKQAYVFHNGNVSTKGKIAYLPVYMLMFVQKLNESGEMIYKIDLSALQ